MRSVVSCQGLPNGRIEELGFKCSRFILHCLGSEYAMAQACPAGTFFDFEVERCDYKHNVPRCGGTRPSATTPSSEETTTTPIGLFLILFYRVFGRCSTFLLR